MRRLRDIAMILSGLNPGAARGDPCKFLQTRDLVSADRPLLEGERPTGGRGRSRRRMCCSRRGESGASPCGRATR